MASAVANQCEHPVERTLKFLRRAARRANDDRGPLRTIADVKQAVGKDKEAVRGYLIKLVARGDVVFHDCINGQAWSAYVEKKPRIAPVEKADGHFILQRELIDDSRGLWFDAETFTNLARAQAALKFAIWETAARAHSDGTARRIQRIRLLSIPQQAQSTPA